MDTRTIGVIDCFLDEFHANFLQKRWAENGTSPKITHAWAEMDKPGGATNGDWCRERGVELLASPSEVTEAVDAVLVLAPANPERHAAYAEAALASGKPVFIDKAMAPDVATGRRMFERAEEHGTPCFSASSLYWAEVVDEVRGAFAPGELNRLAAGCPGTLEEYGVHGLEMLVAVKRCAPRRVFCPADTAGSVVVMEFADGAIATLEILSGAPYRFSVCARDGRSRHLPEIPLSFFNRFFQALSGFLESGRPPVTSEHTLRVLAAREAACQARDRAGHWVEVPEA